MAEPGDPNSPQDGAPQGPEDADLFRDEPAPTPTQRPTWAAPVRPAPEPEPEPAADPHAHDDLIGFTSPASLVGAERREPEPVVEAEPVEIALEDVTPDDFAPEPDVTPIPDPESLILAPAFTTPKVEPKPHDTVLEPTSSWAVETPLAAETIAPTAVSSNFSRPPIAPRTAPTAAPATFGRADLKGGRNGEGEALEGATGLYTIYALILFAVPTFGAAAVIGLLMVWMRPKPVQPLARSHFEFQSRTLWIAAIAAAVGVVLIAVNLGVFVLVAMAMWVIVRGAWGVMTLAAGKPVTNPRTWMI